MFDMFFHICIHRGNAAVVGSSAREPKASALCLALSGWVLGCGVR
jgi:hypothetical protein